MKRIGKVIVSIALVLSLVLALVPYMGKVKKAKAAATYTVYINVSDAVRVRTGPSLGHSAVYDSKGHMAWVYANEPVTVLEKKQNGSDLWYKIAFNYNGENLSGYLHSDFIHDYTGTYDEEYAEELRTKGFPESYIPALCYLHSKHSNWIFTPQFTGTGTSLETSLDWSTALAEEQKTGVNLIQKIDGLPESWLSHSKGYNGYTDVHTSYDSGNFVQASDELIAFYLDPRNMLNEKLVFGFVNLGYNKANQTADGVKNIVANSFMRGALTDNANKTYVQTFMDAAAKTGCSPYLLAAKVLIEQGSHPEVVVPNNIEKLPGNIRGKFTCDDGTALNGYYNYYNIGAYAANGRGAQENGIRFAATVPTGVNTYERPWNSVYKSIMGGAIFISRDYINRGQNTIYLEKYAVVGSNLYSHQYCTAVNWVEGQAYAMAKAYASVTSNIDFNIPVYKNMPDSLYQKPDKLGCPNSFLKSLSVSNYTLTPTFIATTYSYTINVASNVTSVNITAAPVSSEAKVSGTGTKNLVAGKNTFVLTVTAGNGGTRKYTVNVYRAEPPAVTPTPTNPASPTPSITTKPVENPTPVPALSVTSKKYSINPNTIIALAPQTSVKTFLANMTITGSTTKKVTLADGKTEIKDGTIIGNGCKLILDNKTYTLIVNGDPSGDGKVGAKDLLMVKKALIGASKLNAAENFAACVSGNSTIGAKDLLLIKKHLINLTVIKER